MLALTVIRKQLGRWLRQGAEDNRRQSGQSMPDCRKLLNQKKGATT